MRFSLTDVQRAYLMGRSDLFEAGGVSTHAYYEFKNQLDVFLYEKALNRVIARHGMLRAIIHRDGTQEILEQVPRYHVVTTELQNATEAEVEAFITQKRTEMSHWVFALETWPMFDIQAATLPTGETYLFFSCDLLIADGSSLKLFLQEITEFYLDITKETPQPEVDFQDYIAYIEKTKQGKFYLRDKAYWNDMIDSFPSAPMLPSLQRTGKEPPKFSRLQKWVPENIWKALQQKAEQRKITFSLLFYTAYLLVLSKWTAQDKFAINITLSNRGKMQGKLMHTIGDFTSLMLMPVDCSTWSDDFWKCAEQVQRAFMECYKHSSYDGVAFEQECIRKKGLHNQAAFPIVFTGMLSGVSASSVAPILGEIQYSVTQTPQVYLDFQMVVIRNQISLTWDYLTQQYDAEQMEFMFEQFSKLVDAICTEEDFSVSDFLKSDTEQILQVYNQTEAPNEVSTLQQILQYAFSQYGERVALQDCKTQLTYEQWERKSAAVAAYLQSIGVVKGDYVAVKGNRRISTLVQMAGVIRCGAAYVPIAADCPEERLEYILKHCHCKAYLTEESTFQDSASDWNAEVYADAASPAYVIYTSGSTGMPKGVVISNGAVCNTIEHMNQRFSIGKEDVFLGVSSYCFDLSVYDIFGAALAGAKHIIAEDAKDIAALQKIIAKEKVTIWNSVPAIFHILVESCSYRTNHQTLRYVFLSGDWIPLNLLQNMKRYFRKAAMISLGRATEASIWSIYYPVQEIKPAWKSIPYGYPLENQTCYVLDKNMQCCPFNVPGEIYIGGAGLAEQYMHAPELTERAFLMHPVYGRIYKTGDAGVFRRDGYIDILGRLDHQVKINGFRIELGEIESVLEKNEMIDRAVASVVEMEQKKELIAYLKPVWRKAYFSSKEEQKQLFQTLQQAAEAHRGEVVDAIASQFDQQLDAFCIHVIEYYVNVFEVGEQSEKVTVDQWVNKHGIRSIYQKLVRAWFDILVAHGRMIKENDTYYLSREPSYSAEELLSELDALEKKTHSFGFLRDCILHIKEILTGKENILTYFFPEGGMQNADHIYRENQIARYVNRIAAEAVFGLIQQHPSQKIRILEIGAGSGGTTESVLQKNCNENISYHFTDISEFFLQSAQQKFEKYDFMSYGIFDIDKGAVSEEWEPESFDIILAANVMHDAKDLKASVANVTKLLRPNGMFVLLETTRDTMVQMISTRMIDGYSNYADFRIQKNSPLLSDLEWRKFLTDSGFENVQAFPEQLGREIGEHVIIGFRDCTRKYLRKTELRAVQRELKENLPSYMIPGRILQLETIPLNTNGKIDRAALPKPKRLISEQKIFQKPKTALETEIFEIWKEVLGHSNFGIDNHFLEVGGDSVMLLKMMAAINSRFSTDFKFQDLFQNGTISDIAERIGAQKTA